MISPTWGYALALLTSCCWAQNSVAYALAGRRVSSHTVTHIRLWFAFPVLLLVHFLFLGSVLPTRTDSAGFWYLAISGFTGFCITDLCLFKAFVDLGPRQGMVIMSLAPILTTLFAWLFLNEVLTVLQLLGIAVTVGGVVWVILEEGQNGKAQEGKRRLQGVIAGLLAALMQAVSMVLAKRGMIGDMHPISGNLIRVAFGLLGLIAFSLLRGQFANDFRRMRDRSSLVLVSTAALIGPVLGMIAALYALAAAEAGVVTALMQVSPVLLIPVDVLLFKQKLTRGAVAGTVLAVAGAAILFLVPR